MSSAIRTVGPSPAGDCWVLAVLAVMLAGPSSEFTGRGENLESKA